MFTFNMLDALFEEEMDLREMRLYEALEEEEEEGTEMFLRGMFQEWGEES